MKFVAFEKVKYCTMYGIYHVVISVSLSLSSVTIQPKQTIMGRKRLNFNKYKINNNTEKIKRKLFAAKLSTV